MILNTNSTWQWNNWEGLPYLACSLLDDWKHGFFTQGFYPHNPDILVEILQPQIPAYRVKQVHGNKVLQPQEIALDGDNNRPAADGLVTEQPQQSVWVASADCTPVLIGDVATGQVAAVHAGWRGTAQRIVPEAIAKMLACGSDLENLLVALGPAISGSVYQVDREVAVQVCDSFCQNYASETSEEILATVAGISDSPLHPDPDPQKVRLDVRRVNQIQLEQLGIKREQIAIAPYCTYQQPEYFFSYRRTKAKNVQWSGIVSN